MNKVFGFLLLRLSLLTTAIVISLGQVSRAIKETASGSFGINSAFGEIPGIVYLIIAIAVCVGVYLLKDKNNV